MKTFKTQIQSHASTAAALNRVEPVPRYLPDLFVPGTQQQYRQAAVVVVVPTKAR